jgi:cyclophilin family peptidyl-prolyl cis-trans isomerase
MMKKTFLKSLVAVIMLAAQGVRAQDSKPAAPAAPDAKPAETSQPLKGIVKATLETSKGTLELELDADKAPLSVANFVNYAKKGHYDGTIFHRVIPGFMIQGGGFTADMQQKPTDKPIQCESKNGLKNARGTLAMARTSDPHSATSQFFINVKDNGFLDFPGQDGWGYCVFGKVAKGLDVVDAIVAVPSTTKAPHQNVPVDPITITKVTIAP